MLILEFLLGLKSKQGDITAAFLNADIPKDEKVYIEIPGGFEQFSKNGCMKCLKQKMLLYCFRQIPRAFW